MSEARFEGRLAAFDARFDARLNEQQRQHDEDCAKLERERDEYKKLTLILQEQVERLKLGARDYDAFRGAFKLPNKTYDFGADTLGTALVKVRLFDCAAR